ncbi:MAG TPA: MFS transporter [Clostridiales bacterium]|nr:MFS transporter [Clostridiales bacterium]
MKGNNILKVSILSLSFLTMLRLTISPALAAIGEAVNRDATQMQIMVVVASAVAIPFGFVSGLLAGKIKTKTILYIGLILYLIGGMAPMLVPNFTFMIVCRALLGAGTGLFLPYCAGLIADFYKGDEFKTMIGWQSAAVAIGNIVTSALAGILASINWRLSFLIYAFAAVTFILVAAFLPEPPKAEKRKEEGAKFNGRMSFICIAILIYAVIYFGFFGFISYVVAELGGNAAQSGLASMAMTLLSLIAGIIYAGVLHILKKATLPILLLINVLGFFILSQATGFGIVVVGSCFVGLGFGLLLPYGMMRVIEAAPKSAGSFASGMYMTFVNVGTAVAPAILALIGAMFGRKDDGQFVWFVSSILLVAGTVIAIILALTSKSTSASAQE